MKLKLNISEATKDTLKTPLIWTACLLVMAFIQEIFDIYLGNEVIENPVYYCTIIWIMFACLSAKFEAYYYNYAMQDNSPQKPNMHFLLTVIRFIVIIPIWVLTNFEAVICYVAMFPFFHDGSYYVERNRIKPGTYSKRWFAQSTTSTAWTTKFMIPVIRTILAAIAIGMIIVIRYKYI